MTKDLTSGNPFKIILLFTLPLMLGNLFQQFYSLADTIIVGRFVGVNALAAVGATGSDPGFCYWHVQRLCYPHRTAVWCP